MSSPSPVVGVSGTSLPAACSLCAAEVSIFSPPPHPKRRNSASKNFQLLLFAITPSPAERLDGHLLRTGRLFLDEERRCNCDVDLRLLVDNLQRPLFSPRLQAYLRRKQTHRSGRKIIKGCAQFRASIGAQPVPPNRNFTSE